MCAPASKAGSGAAGSAGRSSYIRLLPEREAGETAWTAVSRRSAVPRVSRAFIAGRSSREALRKVDFDGTNNLLIVAVSIGIGMLPVVAPTVYHAFPTWVQIIGGSAITSATLAAFLLNLLFNHTAAEPAVNK
jgi:hypothetical protein